MRFLFIAALSCLGVSAYAQTEPASISMPKVAILELDLGKGIKNNAIARDDFKRLGAEALIAPPTSGERPSNLIALFSCRGLDATCLTQISTSLKVRFVLYGNLEMYGSLESFTVSIFDAESAKILSTETATFSLENRSAEMQKAIQRALAVDGAEAIRVPQKIEAPKPPKESKGLWKFAVPAVLFVVGSGLNAKAISDKSKLTDDGDHTNAERAEYLPFVIAGDASFVVSAGVFTWAYRSSKNNQKSVEQTTVNP